MISRPFGIVGIDLSITSAGIVKLFIEPKYFNTTYRSSTAGTDSKFGPIWKRYEHSLTKILSEIIPEDTVFIEEYAFGGKGDMTHLAELGGLVKFTTWRKTGMYPVELSPGTIKKWLTGSGNAKKEDMKLSLFKKHKLEFGTNDEVDAYALADLGWHIAGLKPRRELTKSEHEILKKFSRPEVVMRVQSLAKQASAKD